MHSLGEWRSKLPRGQRGSTSSSSPLSKFAYYLQLGCSLIYIFVSKGCVVYKQCCHVNLENRSDREFWKRQAEAQNVGIRFATCWLLNTDGWRKVSGFLRCVCFSNWGLSFVREGKDFPHARLISLSPSPQPYQSHARLVIHVVTVSRPPTPLWKILNTYPRFWAYALDIWKCHF